jgi:adenylate cyclase
MTNERVQRRLAAVLSADVVGYSRLMRADEEGTFERLRAHRKQLFEPEIERHRGRIFKLMGDGLLAEFGSVVDAVHCAIELQRSMLRSNTAYPDERRIDMRIGINLGEVIVEEEDRHGDSINLAARLQLLAHPAGICVSEKVRTEVDGKVDIIFENGGEQLVKNIAQPIKVFHWRPLEAPPLLTSNTVVPAGEGRPHVGSGAKPSLMLSSFEVLRGDKKAKSLAAGINEAVASSLANLTGISLIAGSSDVNYQAIGSVQTSGAQYRVTMKLIDKESNKQFWSERFDGSLAKIFDDLDNLAFRICSAIRYEVYERETEKSRLRSPDEQTDEQLMGQAGHILLNSRRTDYELSVRLIDRVVQRDPNNFMALAIRAWASMVEVVCGHRDVSKADAKLALEFARKASELNVRSDFAHLVYGLILLYLKRDLDAAARQARRSLELNANYALAIDLLGMTMIYAGDPDKGLTYSNRALEANPRFPANNWFMDNMAIGSFLCQDYSTAVEWARRSDHMHGDMPRCMLLLIASYFNWGKPAEAQEQPQRLRQIYPDFRVSDLRRWPFRQDKDWDRLVRALLDAQLPP